MSFFDSKCNGEANRIALVQQTVATSNHWPVIPSTMVIIDEQACNCFFQRTVYVVGPKVQDIGQQPLTITLISSLWLSILSVGFFFAMALLASKPYNQSQSGNCLWGLSPDVALSLTKANATNFTIILVTSLKAQDIDGNNPLETIKLCIFFICPTPSPSWGAATTILFSRSPLQSHKVSKNTNKISTLG